MAGLAVGMIDAESSAVFALLRRNVIAAQAFQDGALEATFEDQWRLMVPATEGYEPWGLTRTDGLRIVSVPGGTLSIWNPDGASS
jgi:hypothetical protein